ncbi:MAG TPA: serine/threonine-protein kinase [Fimbriiglobus sp.]|nr:serine/threonine-protein kinase [Fimbriiglobus sp.]
MSDPRPPSVPETGPTPVTPPAAEDGAIGLHAPQDRAKIPRKFGRYRIQDCLGRGGMGAVFRAHDTQLDRSVALKVPFLSGDDAATRERFYREARAAAALHHANICPVYDVGELHGVPYLTMAFVEGRALSKVLEAGESFTPRQAGLMVRKLALAMQEAHARGVIHRDLKPANVIVRPDGEPVVMDFGLARRGDDTHNEGLTRQGDVIGTIEYMSPEQFEGDNAAVGPASDVYSLGVMLYELLTGRRPYEGSTASKMAAILVKPPPRPSEHRPGLPPRLEEICLTAMAKQPADRYATMTQFAVVLTEFLRTFQSGALAPVARSAEAPPTPRPSATTKPIKEKPVPPEPITEGPGWTLVEEDPPAPPPRRSAVKPRLVSDKKKKPQKQYNPVVLGAIALAAACLSVIIAAIIMKVF